MKIYLCLLIKFQEEKYGEEIFQFIYDMDKSEKQKWIIVILTLGIGATLLNEYIG